MKPVTIATILGSTLFSISVFAQSAGGTPDGSQGDAAAATQSSPGAQAMPCGRGGSAGMGAAGSHGHQHHAQGEGHHGHQHHARSEGYHGHHGHHQKMGYKREKMAEHMLKRIDTDGDGQISLDELKTAQQRQFERFEKADANRDGKLSREEMQAMRQAMREEHRKLRQAPSAAPGAEKPGASESAAQPRS
jgi:hypothetical protein